MPFDSLSAANCTTSISLGNPMISNLISIAILAAVTGLLVMIYVDRSVYLKSRRAVRLIFISIEYFMWGLVGVTVIVAIRAVVLYFATPGLGKVPLWFIGVCIVAYIAICMVGYLIVRLKDRISQYESDDKEMPAVSYDGRE